jgi:RING-type zinc-finger
MATGRTEETLQKQVEEVTTCPICHGSFCDPRVLPCSHTFCLKCIKDCASHNHGRFECPLRDGTTVKAAHIDALPINLVIRDIVELVKKKSGEKDQ